MPGKSKSKYQRPKTINLTYTDFVTLAARSLRTLGVVDDSIQRHLNLKELPAPSKGLVVVLTSEDVGKARPFIIHRIEARDTRTQDPAFPVEFAFGPAIVTGARDAGANGNMKGLLFHNPGQPPLMRKIMTKVRFAQTRTFKGMTFPGDAPDAGEEFLQGKEYKAMCERSVEWHANALLLHRLVVGLIYETGKLDAERPPQAHKEEVAQLRKFYTTCKETGESVAAAIGKKDAATVNKLAWQQALQRVKSGSADYQELAKFLDVPLAELEFTPEVMARLPQDQYGSLVGLLEGRTFCVPRGRPGDPIVFESDQYRDDMWRRPGPGDWQGLAFNTVDGDKLVRVFPTKSAPDGPFAEGQVGVLGGCICLRITPAGEIRVSFEGGNMTYIGNLLTTSQNSKMCGWGQKAADQTVTAAQVSGFGGVKPRCFRGVVAGGVSARRFGGGGAGATAVGAVAPQDPPPGNPEAAGGPDEEWSAADLDAAMRAATKRSPPGVDLLDSPPSAKRRRD